LGRGWGVGKGVGWCWVGGWCLGWGVGVVVMSVLWGGGVSRCGLGMGGCGWVGGFVVGGGWGVFAGCVGVFFGVFVGLFLLGVFCGWFFVVVGVCFLVCWG